MLRFVFLCINQFGFVVNLQILAYMSTHIVAHLDKFLTYSCQKGTPVLISISLDGSHITELTRYYP